MKIIKKVVFLSVFSIIFISQTAWAQFSDVPESHPMYPAINYFQHFNIIDKGNNTSFRANDPIKKIEFLKILIGPIDEKEDLSFIKIPFTDLKENEWYSPYVKYALKKSIIDAKETTFNPDEIMKWVDIVPLLYKAYPQVPLPYIAIQIHKFKDVPKGLLPEVYMSLEQALADKLITPISEDRSAIFDLATRIQAVNFLYKAKGAYQELLKPGVTNFEATLFKNVPQELKTVFQAVIETVNRDYLYNTEIDPSELIYSAMAGFVKGLGDPYSGFFAPTDAEELEQTLNGSAEGIGARIDTLDDKIVIVAPLPNSPAEKAGLVAGDIILTVDGESITGMTVTEAALKIRGPKGTSVELEIQRGTASTPFKIKITREEIRVDIVEYKNIGNNIAYFRITQFTNLTASAFAQLYQEKITSTPRGIVLDMRNNPGGLLDSALGLMGLFLKPEEIAVQLKEQTSTQNIKSYGQGTLGDIPLIILINKGSASAAELVAIGLQENGVAKLMGETTFGKGVVQRIYNFPGGSSLKLTKSEWLSPKGNSINHKGVKPDIEVLQDTKTIQDEVLDKALQTLQ